MYQQNQVSNKDQLNNNCECSKEPIFAREYEEIIGLDIEKFFEKYFKSKDEQKEENLLKKYFNSIFNKWYVRHYVGILPFYCEEHKRKNYLIIGPKKKNGSEKVEDIENDILNFSYFSVFSGYPESFDEIKVAKEPKWKIKGLSNQRLGIYFLTIIYGNVLDSLCKKDFRKSYIPKEEELISRVKGRVNQREYINNWWNGKRLNIPCRWEEFTEDNLENRVLKYALKKLEFLKIDISWHNEILLNNFRIAKWKFQDICDIDILDPTIFNYLKLNKISKYYKNALDVAKQIIFGSEDIKVEEGIPPILFDTNVLFERVVQKICKISGIEDGWEVKRNPSDYYIFKNNEKVFKPDVVMERENDVIVADAKYKLILESDKESLEDILFNPDTKDLYQMYFYMRNLNAKRGIFFVPVWNDIKYDDPKIFKKSPLDNQDNAELHIFPINLGAEDLKKEIKDKINKFKEIFLK